MNNDQPEDDRYLESLFQSLRREEEAGAPGFAESTAPPQRTWAAGPATWAAGGLAILAAVVVPMALQSPAPPAPTDPAIQKIASKSGIPFDELFAAVDRRFAGEAESIDDWEAPTGQFLSLNN